MFIGQKKIVNELNIIAKELKENPNHAGVNLLFRAPSGYGKTILSFGFCNVFDKGRYEYLLPNDEGVLIINPEKRTHILDEIHTCKNQEALYPYMDMGKHVFILTTNETGELKEPLQNRCINLTFEEYTEDELFEIIDSILSPFKLTRLMYKLLTDYSHCPRVLVKLCQRLTYLFKNYAIPQTVEDFRLMLESVLNIKDGLDEEQRRYIEFLNRVGYASLDLISASIKIDKATLKRDIEPGLLYKNLISISSRGRSIND